jgi:hypothetical protein
MPSIRQIHTILSLVLLATISLVSATGDFGPNTCLEGWVWRQAVANDDVCVTPATRTQTQQDNAAAKSRVNPNGGPFGPNTCLNGYVWREAVPGDDVCVTVATRSQAAADNAQAANRVASLNLWITDWYTPETSDQPMFQVNGDHFNIGQVTVGMYWSDINEEIQPAFTQNAVFHTGYIGGSFGVQFNGVDCSQSDPSTPQNAYAKAYDWTSSRWSAPFLVKEC